jgi:hypothetical protein
MQNGRATFPAIWTPSRVNCSDETSLAVSLEDAVARFVHLNGRGAEIDGVPIDWHA